MARGRKAPRLRANCFASGTRKSQHPGAMCHDFQEPMTGHPVMARGGSSRAIRGTTRPGARGDRWAVLPRSKRRLRNLRWPRAISHQLWEACGSSMIGMLSGGRDAVTLPPAWASPGCSSQMNQTAHDSPYRNKILELLARLRRELAHALIITHDLGVVGR